jgi:hypothetical protein
LECDLLKTLLKEGEKEMGGAAKNKETQGNMKKRALTLTETGCGTSLVAL